ASAWDFDRTDLVAHNGKDKHCYGLEKTTMDPLVFFDDLVERYRQLDEYRDTTQLLQITRRPGEEDLKQETKLLCEIRDEELIVETPMQKIREGFGLNLPIKTTDAMQQMQRRYQLWLAPHMALRFVEHPLQDLREGVEDGFTPRVAAYVIHNDRRMVHLKLKSGDGLSEMSQTTFDFYINPESMLIEHIECVEHRPDGSDFITTLQITPFLDDDQQTESLVG
ncbi:MAG: hypothetical protein O7G85_13990, partial [Planctomycetota bacterium]|nr:hypothetical protein [Planctomycetota bacterium]